MHSIKNSMNLMKIQHWLIHRTLNIIFDLFMFDALRSIYAIQLMPRNQRNKRSYLNSLANFWSISGFGCSAFHIRLELISKISKVYSKMQTRKASNDKWAQVFIYLYLTIWSTSNTACYKSTYRGLVTNYPTYEYSWIWMPKSLKKKKQRAASSLFT